MFAIIIDIAVILLLVMTIIFCWRLNNKIIELKSGRKDLLELVKTLDSAILKTNTNISELKVMSQNSAVELSGLVSQAQEYISDLNFMNETALKLADRLERNISDARYVAEKLQTEYSNRHKVANDLPKHPPAEIKIEPTNPSPSPSPSQNLGIKNLKSGFSRAKEELISALRFVK
ncbi:MAG: hypothetical protein K0Q51_1568 [Rickettsiaceae bacterium]|jgi:capsule polysaccharide export protein KpsE/RkpR|nr:hypothetical protein [Rickettsiaceae bacterium]